MPFVFADTSYWQGRYFPQDQWHQAALAAERRLGHQVHLLTTKEVLTEFLAWTAGNQRTRRVAIETMEEIQNNTKIRILSQSAETFAKGFELYRNRMDKGYSLVDCISNYGITQVLTSDHHFEQEGRYTALMRR